MSTEEPSHDSRLHRRIRASVVSLLLAGSLLPTVGGIPVHLLASVALAPLLAWELIRPGKKSVFMFAAWTVGLMVIAGQFVDAPRTDYGIEKYRSLWSSTAISALSVSLLRDRQTLLTFARTWVLIGAFLALATLASGGGGGRAIAFGSNPIWLGRALATAALVAIWLGWQKYLRRLYWIPLAAVLALGLFATGSRGPTAGLALGLFAISFFATSGRSRRVVTIALAAVLGGLAIVAIPAVRNSRIGDFAFDVLSDSDSADIGVRSEMWSRTVALIVREPAGVGFGNWSAMAPAPSRHNYPHNMFLELAAEAGVLTALLLIATICLVLYRLARRSRMDAVVSLSMGLLLTELIAVSVSGDLNARSFFAFAALAWSVSTWYGAGQENGMPEPQGESATPLSESREYGLRGMPPDSA